MSSIRAISAAALTWPQDGSLLPGDGYRIHHDPEADGHVDYDTPSLPSDVAAWPDGVGRSTLGGGQLGVGPLGIGDVAAWPLGQFPLGAGLLGCGARNASVTIGGLRDGRYTFAVRSVDVAGNLATAATAGGVLSGTPEAPTDGRATDDGLSWTRSVDDV